MRRFAALCRLALTVINSVVLVLMTAAPSWSLTNAFASEPDLATAAPNDRANLFASPGRAWTIRTLPDGSSGILPATVTTHGGCVVGVPKITSVFPGYASDAERICYIFNDKWPSGFPLKARDDFAFRAVVISPNGRTFVSEMLNWTNRHKDSEAVLACFSTADARCLGSVAVGKVNLAHAVAFSPSGDYVACAHAVGISIFAVPTMARCYFLNRCDNSGRGNIRAATFSADGRYAAIIEWGQGVSERYHAAVGDPTREGATPAAEAPPNLRERSSPPAMSPTAYSSAVLVPMPTAGRQDEIKLVELRSGQVCWRVACEDSTYEPAPRPTAGCSP